MRKFGRVVSSEKDYMDIKGYRIANEKRLVLFSSINDTTSLNHRKIDIGNFLVHASIENLNQASVLRKRSSKTPSANRRKSYQGQVWDDEEDDKEKWGSLLAGVNRSFNCRECAGGSTGGGSCRACGRGMARRGTIAGVGRMETGRDWRPPPKDELLEFLRGNRRPSRDNMSAVAYRQSMVVRDDGGIKNNFNDDVAVSGREVLGMLAQIKKKKEFAQTHKENNFNYHRKLSLKEEEKEEEAEKYNSLGWLKKFGSNKLERFGLKREDRKDKIRKEKVRSLSKNNGKKNETDILNRNEPFGKNKSCLKNPLNVEKQSTIYNDSVKTSNVNSYKNLIAKSSLSTTKVTTFSKAAEGNATTGSGNTGGMSVLDNIKKFVKSPQKKKKQKDVLKIPESPKPVKPILKSDYTNYASINDKYFNKNTNTVYNNNLNNSNKTSDHNNDSKSNMTSIENKDAFEEFSKVRRRQKRNEAFQELSAYLMF